MDIYRGDGLNLYAFCGMNPVMYVDPSGNGKGDNKIIISVDQYQNDKFKAQYDIPGKIYIKTQVSGTVYSDGNFPKKGQ